ncbi:hypothetical protein M8C21_000965 [Ambrosia artemisiifolia]|uniref:F-box domain-containing protein n=1 Tax=Ambrosia artemisiifolia TaxID=4212 RepID=A0AAD5CAY9_AMBAR|nr:hypothetical protein M8C21_000965 [Ambrosia artemisiifolia]
MDRISHLPDSILHHILAFANTPADLIRMSVLSKTWFHLTASFPILDFNIHRFTSRACFFKYIEHATSRFCLHNLTAHTFKLIATIQEPTELDVVNRCLRLLPANGVKELVISIDPEYRLRLPDIPLFCVYGHQNLQRVCLCYTPVEIIDIEAPNLSDLYVDEVDDRGPPQMNLASCKKLTSLSYYGSPLPNSNGFLSNFPFLENLDLFSRNEGNNLKLSSHSLRTLELNSDCDLEEIELSTPNLGLFIYTRSQHFYSIGISHLPHLKACMRCWPGDAIDTLWVQKLRLFLDKENGFIASNLYIHMDQEFIVSEKLKAIELPPYELEHIELHFEDDEEDHAAFVEAVLCCFRPRSLTLKPFFPPTDFEEKSSLVNFTYKKLLEQENQSHISIQIVSPNSSKAQKQFKGLMVLPEPSLLEEGTLSNKLFLYTNYLPLLLISKQKNHAVKGLQAWRFFDALGLLGVYRLGLKIRV